MALALHCARERLLTRHWLQFHAARQTFFFPLWHDGPRHGQGTSLLFHDANPVSFPLRLWHICQVFTSIDLTETKEPNTQKHIYWLKALSISNHVAGKHGQVTIVGADWFTETFGQPGSRVPVDGLTERSKAQGGERKLFHPRTWKASSNNRSTPKEPLSSTPNFSASRVCLDTNRKGSPASEALGCTTEENRTLCQRAERGW